MYPQADASSLAETSARAAPIASIAVASSRFASAATPSVLTPRYVSTPSKTCATRNSPSTETACRETMLVGAVCSAVTILMARARAVPHRRGPRLACFVGRSPCPVSFEIAHDGRASVRNGLPAVDDDRRHMDFQGERPPHSRSFAQRSWLNHRPRPYVDDRGRVAAFRPTAVDRSSGVPLM